MPRETATSESFPERICWNKTVYLIESGLLVFIFCFRHYFQLALGPTPLSESLSASAISRCVHLGILGRCRERQALPDSKRIILVFLNMATYHVCVLIWFYYLLVPAPQSSPRTPTVPPA